MKSRPLRGLILAALGAVLCYLGYWIPYFAMLNGSATAPRSLALQIVAPVMLIGGLGIALDGLISWWSGRPSPTPGIRSANRSEIIACVLGVALAVYGCFVWFPNAEKRFGYVQKTATGEMPSDRDEPDDAHQRAAGLVSFGYRTCDEYFVDSKPAHDLIAAWTVGYWSGFKHNSNKQPSAADTNGFIDLLADACEKNPLHTIWREAFSVAGAPLGQSMQHVSGRVRPAVLGYIAASCDDMKESSLSAASEIDDSRDAFSLGYATGRMDASSDLRPALEPKDGYTFISQVLNACDAKPSIGYSGALDAAVRKLSASPSAPEHN